MSSGELGGSSIEPVMSLGDPVVSFCKDSAVSEAMDASEFDPWRRIVSDSGSQ